MKLNFIRSLKRNKKGISTVIATIIIVAISIVMAISVAYWALGIGNSFTRFEKLQFNSAYVTISGTNYLIHVDLKNTGTATATIDNTMINGRPCSTYSPQVVSTIGGSIEPGSEITGATISMPMSDWSSGMTIEVTIQTTAGNSYPKTVTLP